MLDYQSFNETKKTSHNWFSKTIRNEKMAKIFISYSHQDKGFVQSIMDQINTTHHEIVIDNQDFEIGSPINHTILKSIAEAEFILVFLSSNSVNSNWVLKEIYSSLYCELKDKQTKLIPCIIDDCTLPKNLFKFKQYERINLDFKTNFEDSIQTLKKRLESTNPPIFENENYFVLKIPVSNLEIYMTGELYDWQKNSQLKYVEMIDSYLLFGFNKVPNTFFKHFVICDLDESSEIKDIILNAGYYAPGFGDIDPETGKRRIWFSVREYPIFGKNNNNKWL
jgi:hypothetical protein